MDAHFSPCRLTFCKVRRERERVGDEGRISVSHLLHLNSGVACPGAGEAPEALASLWGGLPVVGAAGSRSPAHSYHQNARLSHPKAQVCGVCAACRGRSVALGRRSGVKPRLSTWPSVRGCWHCQPQAGSTLPQLCPELPHIGTCRWPFKGLSWGEEETA